MRYKAAFLLAATVLNCFGRVLVTQMPAQQLGGPLVLEKQPKLRAGDGSDMEAFPRVRANANVRTDVAAKINASLQRFENEAVQDARECSRREKELHTQDGELAGDWERTVEVTMRGPRYVSYVAEDIYDCGGPHPLDGQTALVYDLNTGLPVNWARVLPPQATGKVIRSPHRLAIGVVHWPTLLQKARKQADADCAEAYRDDSISFTVWLSGKDHAIVFSPNLRSHYDNATCGQGVELDATEAAKSGVAPELVEALRAAR